MPSHLPNEVIGRIIYYCQPRHSLFSPNHQAERHRRDLHQRLSRVGRVWRTYPTEQAIQYLFVRLESEEGEESDLSLSQADWGKWSKFNVEPKDCQIRYQPRYLILSSDISEEVNFSDNNWFTPDFYLPPVLRTEERTLATVKACSQLEEASFGFLNLNYECLAYLATVESEFLHQIGRFPR